MDTMAQWMRGWLLTAGALLLAAGQTPCQDKPAGKSDKPDPMIQAMIKAGTPGPEHQRLTPLAGSWSGTVKMWMEPGKPPIEEACTSERKLILGGRFLQEEVKSQFFGQPFQGMGLTGYDNLQKKYTGIWVDSMGTGISTSVGTADAQGKVFTYSREEIDPVSGKKSKNKDVIRVVSTDKNVMESYRLGPDGKEIKVMEIVLTRKK
jgi:hypothetical protein